MHTTAYNIGRVFFETYCNGDLTVVDIGSQDVNGTLRDHAGQNIKYIGVDFAEGRGVDVVLTDPYKFPIEDNIVDRVVSSSCFEHSEMFWITFMEGMRILKPDGVMYINAPAMWEYHGFPTDCWRFYPGAGKALETWARYNGLNSVLLETYLMDSGETNKDWVGIYLKDAQYREKYTKTTLEVFGSVQRTSVISD